MTKLSEYFTLEELVFSDYAIRKDISNTPSLEMQVQLTRTALKMDDVRRLLGRPVLVSSGYRCIELNRAIGSIDNSQHVKGEAADFKSPEFGSVKQVFDCIRNSDIEYDQLILECNSWVHISFSKNNRRQCLSFDGKKYKAVS